MKVRLKNRVIRAFPAGGRYEHDLRVSGYALAHIYGTGAYCIQWSGWKPVLRQRSVPVLYVALNSVCFPNTKQTMPPENHISFDEIATIGNLLLQELRAVHSTLKENNRQTRRKSTVAERVKMLLKEFPRPDWSAVELAKEIGSGCTDAAVRQTAIWKTYRKMQRTEQSSHSNKDFCADDFISEIDEKLDGGA
ncbi:MAG: hypothetical protein LBU65_17325 [Planctomycetaceae bacterium]|jgi:hypothetical protein|nr:hypothetical protein [Planctomycetaceae bacterium]